MFQLLGFFSSFIEVHTNLEHKRWHKMLNYVPTICPERIREHKILHKMWKWIPTIYSKRIRSPFFRGFLQDEYTG